eukprot:gene9871-10917_t
MRIRLYLVRHAETIANRNNILQGHCDYPLTVEGEQHARALGELLKHKIWKKTYSSDLKRALSSTNNILSQSVTGNYLPELVHTDLLREVNFGVREGLPRGTSVLEALEIKAAQANISVDEVIDTAETLDQVIARQQSFLAQLYDDLSLDLPGHHSSSDDAVLCISHGGYIRRFLTQFCGITVEKIGNCSVSIIQVTWKSREEVVCTTSAQEVNLPWSSEQIP